MRTCCPIAMPGSQVSRGRSPAKCGHYKHAKNLTGRRYPRDSSLDQMTGGRSEARQPERSRRTRRTEFLPISLEFPFVSRQGGRKMPQSQTSDSSIPRQPGGVKRSSAVRDWATWFLADLGVAAVRTMPRAVPAS